MRTRVLVLVAASLLGITSCTHSAGTPLVPLRSSSGTAALRSAEGVGYRVVHNFSDGADGRFPASVIALRGDLYGTTGGGGSSRYGTIFKIGKFGAEQVIHSFQGSDGAEPDGLKYVNGALYGTTFFGGAGCHGFGCGTVFKSSLSGVTRVLHRFRGGTDGADPDAMLTDVDGTLYGTTIGGGRPGACGGLGCGTVFSVSTAGMERVLYGFKGGADGDRPQGSLVAVNGTLYGTTVYGGTGCGGGCGTIFSISTSGAERVLYRFNIKDGKGGCAIPYGGLTYVNEALYGTAGASYGGGGCVFKLTTSGELQVLYIFKGGGDGLFPAATLTNVDGVLYGTTTSGGGPGCPMNNGCGVIFSVTTSGTERVIHRFRGRSGADPETRLIDVGGTLYGTTRGGGTYRLGTVFSLKA